MLIHTWFNTASFLSLFLNASRESNTTCPVDSQCFKEQKNNEIKHPLQSQIYSLSMIIELLSETRSSGSNLKDSVTLLAQRKKSKLSLPVENKKICMSFFLMFLFLRDRVQVGEGQREGDTEFTAGSGP